MAWFVMNDYFRYSSVTSRGVTKPGPRPGCQQIIRLKTDILYSYHDAKIGLANCHGPWAMYQKFEQNSEEDLLVLGLYSRVSLSEQ